jgi:hypothetical protein
MKLRLLILPPPFKEESLGGYILRLIKENGYPNTSYIYRFINTNQRLANNPYKTDIIKTDLEQLSILLNLNKDVLLSMLSPYKDSNSSNYLLENEYQTNTNSKFFSINNRLCPHCLKEFGYIKKYWDIFFVTTCLVHNCQLVDQCPNCKKKIKYNRKSIFKCGCGFDFRDIEHNTMDASSHYVTKLILNLCGYSHEEIDSPLSRISLEEVVETFLLIIRQIYRQRYITSPKVDINILHNYLIKTYQIFDNWPGSLYKILDNYDDNPENIFGIRSFGELYQLCFGGRHSHLKIDIIRDAYKDYIETKWTNGHAFMLKNVSLEKGKFEYVNLSRAADILNKTEESIKELLEKGELDGVIRKGDKNNYYIISNKSVNEYKLRTRLIKQTTILQQEVEEILDTNHSVIKKLREEGILPPVNSPKFGSNEGYRYRIEDIQYLFKLMEKNLYRESTDLCEWVSFSEARELLNCSFVNFIRYLENNPLLVYKRTETDNLSIKNYLFNKFEILNKVKKGVNGYSREELRKIFNVSKEVIKSWLDSGYIPYELNKSKKVIKDQHIDYFKQNYITVNSINLKEELRNIKLKVNYLESRGIHPVDSINGPLYSINELKNKLKQDFIW